MRELRECVSTWAERARRIAEVDASRHARRNERVKIPPTGPDGRPTNPSCRRPRSGWIILDHRGISMGQEDTANATLRSLTEFYRANEIILSWSRSRVRTSRGLLLRTATCIAFLSSHRYVSLLSSNAVSLN